MARGIRIEYAGVFNQVMARGSKEPFMIPRRIVAILSWALVLFYGNGVCRAADGFESVRCGSDIQQILTAKVQKR